MSNWCIFVYLLRKWQALWLRNTCDPSSSMWVASLKCRKQSISCDVSRTSELMLRSAGYKAFRQHWAAPTFSVWNQLLLRTSKIILYTTFLCKASFEIILCRGLVAAFSSESRNIYSLAELWHRTSKCAMTWSLWSGTKSALKIIPFGTDSSESASLNGLQFIGCSPISWSKTERCEAAPALCDLLMRPG